MRKLVIALTVALIPTALPVLADGPPQPVQIVAGILSLSEQQIASWIDLLQAREAAVQPLQQQFRARQEALATLLQSGSPDPAAVGQLLIEAHAIEQQIAAIVMQTNAQFQQILNDEQRGRLQHIREAAQVCPAVPAFHATGLL